VRATYRDLREYPDEPSRGDLLMRVHAPINKDSELASLVHRQFRGLKSEQRKGRLFTRPAGNCGRSFDASVAISLLAAAPAAYATAMRTADYTEVSELFERAILSPLPPVQVRAKARQRAGNARCTVPKR
jgi:hypothetical protein